MCVTNGVSLGWRSLTGWPCELCHNTEGKYVINVTTAALARVFASRDPGLSAIIVQGDEVVVEGRGVRTRAKTKAAPSQYQQIPLLAKIGKLLIKQYGSELYDDKEEAEAAAAGGGAADDDDSDGEEWADEEDDALAGIAKKSPFAPAEDYEFDLSHSALPSLAANLP
jgi:hypothetical protein